MKVPRYYQTDAHEAIRSAFNRRLRRVIIELATGLGKTVIFVLMTIMTNTKGGRVLILVNRDILITQAIEELKLNGVFADREQGPNRASLTSEVVVASIQSCQGKWLKKWPKNHFKLVITDEVHGSAAPTFRCVLDHFGDAYHVGVTATAERHDKKGLWKGYQDIVYRMPLYNWTDKETGIATVGGIDDGWLVPFDFHDLDCPVTLDEKLMSKANFSETEEVFDSNKYLPRLVEAASDHFQGKKGLHFAPNCRISSQMAEMFRAVGFNVQHIDSTYMPPSQTDDLLAWFAETKDCHLFNAQLLTTGFNQPDIDLLGMFRPFASEPAFKQGLGRGTRPVAPIDSCPTAEERRACIASSIKPACRVITPFWENGNHNLATPSCLITDDKDERAELNKKRKPGQAIDLANMEQQLVAKRMADKDEEMRKYAEKVANSQAKKRKPGDVFIDDIIKQRDSGEVASGKQLGFLRYLSGRNFYGMNLTKKQASRIIGRYKPESKAA